MRQMHKLVVVAAVAACTQIAAGLSRVSSAVALSGNHSAATKPFWQNYDYCQGRSLEPGETWHPLADAQLVKLVVLHRHGARSPANGKVPGDNTEWYKCGDPYEAMTIQGDSFDRDQSPLMREQTTIDGGFRDVLWKGNCDAGQLTTMGSHRMNVLGQDLRKVYVDTAQFLPTCLKSDYQISHTYIWRTRTSVENLFTGLYPSQFREPGQFLTMHVKPSLIETAIPNTGSCPRLAALMTAYASSPAYAAQLAPFSSLQSTLVSAYNTSNIKGFNNTQGLWDSASAAYCHGLGLKGNLTGAEIQTLSIPATAPYHAALRSSPNATETVTLAVGPWLKEIVAAISSNSTKLQVFSAHDASLDMFLAVVADPDLPWPPFSSSIEIELWRHHTKGDLVRIYYEGMVVPARPGLNCTFEGCPWAVLEDFLQDFIPKDVASACKV